MEGDREFNVRRYSTSNRNWQRESYRVRGGKRRKRRRKPWGERIVDWTRALIAFLFSNVGIVCLVVGYTIAGAFLFTHIEGRNNLDIVGDVIRLRNVTAATLWELTSKVNIFIYYFIYYCRVKSGPFLVSRYWQAVPPIFFFFFSITFCFIDSAFFIIGLSFTIIRNSRAQRWFLMILKTLFFFLHFIYFIFNLLFFRKIEKEFVSTSVYNVYNTYDRKIWTLLLFFLFLDIKENFTSGFIWIKYLFKN